MERVELPRDQPALGDALASLARRIAPVRGFAIFALSTEAATLVYGDRVDQQVLALGTGLVAEWPLQLERGAPFFGLRARPFVLLPCTPHRCSRGVAYLEIGRPLTAAESDALRQLMAVLDYAFLGASPVVTSPSESVDRLAGPARLETHADVDAANLVAFLEKYEWNITRAARLLAVTRMTIYNRLRRFGIRRGRRPRAAAQRLAS